MVVCFSQTVWAQSPFAGLHISGLEEELSHRVIFLQGFSCAAIYEFTFFLLFRYCVDFFCRMILFTTDSSADTTILLSTSIQTCLYVFVTTMLRDEVQQCSYMKSNRWDQNSAFPDTYVVALSPSRSITCCIAVVLPVLAVMVEIVVVVIVAALPLCSLNM